MNKSNIIELTDIRNPNIINGLDFSLPLSSGIYLGEDNLLLFFILERLKKGLFTTKIKDFFSLN